MKIEKFLSPVLHISFRSEKRGWSVVIVVNMLNICVQFQNTG